MKKRYLLPMLAGGAYMASPVDGIPDFIPLLGQIDDVAMLIIVALVLIVANMMTEKSQ